MPAIAADKDAGDFKVPKSQPNKNDGKGSASDAGVALAKAKKSKKRTEIVSQRTATQTVFANPSGTITRETSQAPIRAKNAKGELVAVDTALAVGGDRLEPKNTTENLDLSSDGSGGLAVLQPSKNTAVSVTVGEDLAKPAVDGAVATYPVEGNPNEEVSIGALDNGFEARVVLKEAPQAAPQTTGPTATPNAGTNDVPKGATADDAPTYTFDFTLDGLTAELVDNRIELRDAKDKLVASSRPLQMWDSAVDAAGDPSNVASVDAKLTKTATGARLVLSPSAKFLADPATKYPVTIDPDVTVPVNGDTWYYSGQTSADNKVNDSRLAIGSPDGTQTRRALVYVNYQSFLGQTVTSASLRLRQYYAATCTSKQTNLYPTSEDVPSPIWGNQPDIFPDARWSSSKSFNHGTTGCSRDFETIDITPMVNGWAGKHINGDSIGNNRQGIRLRAANETDTSQEKRFCSHQPTSISGDPCNTVDNIPVFSVTYTPELGTQSWYSMTNHSLNDHSSISVNNKNGNAVLQAQDVNVNGIGLNLNITRTYNSQTVGATTLGSGWGFNIGPDVWLEKKSTYRYDFHGPSGTVLGSFVRKAATPPSPVNYSNDYYDFKAPLGGVGADLDQKDAGKFTLKFRKSRTKYVFDKIDAAGNAYMTQIRDRDDNHIDIAYGSATINGKPQWTQISDSASPARTYAVTYSGNYVSKIANTASGVGLREWEYGHNAAGELSTYQDPMDKTTTYGYSAGPGLLSSITAPAITVLDESGSLLTRSPQTDIGYAPDPNSTTPVYQVSEINYKYGDATAAAYKYTWDYDTKTSRAPDCADNNHGDLSTVVTDPNGHDTTYCFDYRTDAAANAKAWAYDAKHKARSIEYTADNGPAAITNPSGQSGTQNSTVMHYTGGNLSDQLSSIEEPRNETGGSATTGFDYTGPDNGGPYQPTAVRNSDRTCNRFGYDGEGHTKASYTGVTKATAANDASTCGSNSTAGGREFHRNYNANGTVSESWDGNAPNASGDPDPADKTIYTYWSSGNGTGQLKSIRKPGGDCSDTVAAGRRLCTSYTYDGAGRVTSVTNGNANKITYTYDLNDRTTAAFFNGAAGCNLLGGGCYQYTYDAEGNLIQRTGDGGTSTFRYDRLNRQVQQITPTGNLLSSDTLGQAYDGVGNLKAFAQSVDSGAADLVTYTYDPANALSSVASAATGTTIDVATDDDGRTSSITFPKPTGTNGAKVEYGYSKSGKPTDMDLKTHAGTVIGAFNYDYKLSVFGVAVDVPQMQGRTVTTLSNLASDVDYSYTDDQRLTQANDLGSGTDYSYDYDKVGNITKEQGSSTSYYGYDEAGELCWKGSNAGASGDKLGRSCPTAPSGNTAISHDLAGNITNTSADPIVYNDHDQVTTIGGATMNYLDLGNDLRLQTGSGRTVNGPMGISATKTAGGVITYYVRDPQGTILSSHEATGTNTRNYVTEPNGSVSVMTNPAGTVIGSYKYAPYGATTVNGEAGGTAAASNPFRYIGGYQDKTSSGADGYYKLGARYYDAHGHFTQPDSIQGTINDPKTLTAYNYAGADPINASDPSGNKFDVPGAIGKARTALGIASGCKDTNVIDSSNCAAAVGGTLGGTAVAAVCLGGTFGLGSLGCAGLGTASFAAFAGGIKFSHELGENLGIL